MTNPTQLQHTDDPDAPIIHDGSNSDSDSDNAIMANAQDVLPPEANPQDNQDQEDEAQFQENTFPENNAVPEHPLQVLLREIMAVVARRTSIPETTGMINTMGQNILNELNRHEIDPEAGHIAQTRWGRLRNILRNHAPAVE